MVSATLIRERDRAIEDLECRLSLDDQRLPTLCQRALGIGVSQLRAVTRGAKDGLSANAASGLARLFLRFGMNGDLALHFLNPRHRRFDHHLNRVKDAIGSYDPDRDQDLPDPDIVTIHLALGDESRELALRGSQPSTHQVTLGDHIVTASIGPAAS